LLVFCLAAQRLAMLRAPLEFEFSSQHCFVFASYVFVRANRHHLWLVFQTEMWFKVRKFWNRRRVAFHHLKSFDWISLLPLCLIPFSLQSSRARVFLSYRKNTLTRSHLRFRRDSMSGPLKRTKMKCSPSRSTLGCMISLF
jgi:hypothetical protein